MLPIASFSGSISWARRTSTTASSRRPASALPQPRVSGGHAVERIERRRAVEGGDGLPNASRREEGEADAEGDLGVVRAKRCRSPQLPLRLCPLERLRVHVAERRVRLGQRGVECDGALRSGTRPRQQRSDAPVEVVRRHAQHRGEQRMCASEVGVQRDRLRQLSLGEGEVRAAPAIAAQRAQVQVVRREVARAARRGGTRASVRSRAAPRARRRWRA